MIITGRFLSLTRRLSQSPAKHLDGLLALLLFAFHGYTLTFTSIPVLHPDEASYLEWGKRFFGGLWNAPEFNQFYPGYGLLLTPLTWTFASFAHLYTAGQTLNALWACLQFFIIVKIAKEVGYRSLTTSCVCFGICLYPSTLAYSNVLLPENLLAMLFALQVLLFLKLKNSQHPLQVSMILLLALAMATIHPRGIIVLIASILALATEFVFKANHVSLKKRWLSLGLAGGVLALIGSALMAGVGGYGFDHTFVANIMAHASAHHFFVFLTVIAGTLWYLGYATLGVGFIGIYQLKHSITAKNPRERLAAIFIGLCLVGILVAPNLDFLSRVDPDPALGRRGDVVIYGRYVEMIMAPLLLLGWRRLFQPRVFGPLGLSLGCFGWLCGLIYWQYSELLKTKYVGWTMIFAASPNLVFDQFDLRYTYGLFLSTLLPFVIFLRLRPALANLYLSLLFISTTVVGMHNLFSPLQNLNQENLDLLRPLKICAEVKPLCNLHIVAKNNSVLWSTKAQLPINVNFDWHRQKTPDFSLDLRHKQQLPIAGVSRSPKVALFVHDEQLQEHLHQAGALLPRCFPCPLPEAAFAAQIIYNSRWGLTTLDHQHDVVPLRLQHLGAESFWPRSLGRNHEIYIRAFVVDLHSQVLAGYWDNLPENSIYPGETGSARIQFPSWFNRLPDATPLALVFRLFQDQVRYFPEEQSFSLFAIKNGSKVTLSNPEPGLTQKALAIHRDQVFGPPSADPLPTRY